ncbi:hypothetical protein E1263_30745 [Kribbella antibiotica]|uniref:Uncharacterized protein n=1 Tax=Kribbella antibiotica TaxID=190195 RepID=A0A4R4YYU0_9ACTN|nr:hypothetical protein [Kribbella antibiotica]TDD50708.1 hypothetical protein E1263_30745 [Kribbella antibiotica]
MSENPPEFTRPQLRRLNREYRKAGRQGTKDLKAAFAMARKDVKNMDPALREGIGRANLSVGDLSAMAQRSVSGVHSGNARAELGALGRAAQDRGTGPRNQSTSLVGMLSNAVSRWSDMRRGTKMLKAAYAQAAKDAKTMDPVVRAQVGHSTMTRGDLGYLAQQNLTQALQSPGEFQTGPGLSAEQLGPQQESFAPQQSAEQLQAYQQAQRMEAIRSEIGQLRERITGLEQQLATLEAAGNQQQQPEVQSPEVQQPEAPSAETQSPTAEQPAVEQPAAQSPAAEQHVGQHEVVPTDRAEAQQWAESATGEQPTQQPAQPEAQQPGEPQSPQQPAVQGESAQPRGTAQPVFQAAGEQPTTQPGQPGRPAVEQPAFQAAGEQPNEAARKAEATRAAAAAFDGTAGVRPSTPELAAKTAQADPNKADRSTGQTTHQKNDPNGRTSR